MVAVRAVWYQRRMDPTHLVRPRGDGSAAAGGSAFLLCPVNSAQPLPEVRS